MPIYQHETIEPVYGKAKEYLDGIIRICVPEVCEPRGLKMIGVFQTDGSTGVWPEVIAIWELTGWEAFATKGKTGGTHEGLTRWMLHAAQWRQKGFDRQMIPVSFSPKPPTYPNKKSQGAIFVQQTMLVQPGKMAAYLEQVQKTVLPQAKNSGVTLEAFWRSAYRPLELIALWSMRDWDQYATVQRKVYENPDKSSGPVWMDSAWSYLSDLEEKVLAPAPYSPLGGGGADYRITT